MAPTNIEKIRATIRSRLAEALKTKGWDESELAAAAQIKPITVVRWMRSKDAGGTVPSLTDARKAADALDVTLDWLTGHELSAAQSVAAVAARVERETEEVRHLLDRLIADLASARAALVRLDEAELDVAVGRVRKQRPNQAGKPVAVPGETPS